MNEQNQIKANRENWDDRVPVHLEDTGEFYDIAGFLAGKTTLKPVELTALGATKGKSLLHLMCHIGLDTLSWAREGAHVTGIDFSEKAIAAAKELAAQTELDATFMQSDVYDLPSNLSGQFDIVFASYGVLCWLPDLTDFIAVAAHFLKPGGRFCLIDGHPLLDVFEYNPGKKRLEVAWTYFQGEEPERCDVRTSYTNRSRTLQHTTTYQWGHDLGSVVEAVLQNHLQLTSLKEYPFCFYQRYPDMDKDAQGYWHFAETALEIPMLFSLTAVKPLQFSSNIEP